MRQPDHEYEERSFGDILRAIDFENSMNDLESQLYYQLLSPKEVAQQVLKATCQFYDADWCGLIQVDLDLNLWTPFWWFNAGATDKTMLLTEEYVSAEFLDRWVQTVRKGIPMVVPDAEATKEAYPAEYNLYSGLASGLLLPFPWSRAQSLCLPSGILSGIFSRPVCCGFWPMCCLRRTANRRC